MDDHTLRFEPSSHTYWLGQRRVPSVTQILCGAGLIPENDFATTSVGTEVHRLTAAIDQGEDPRTDPAIDRPLGGYLAAWEKAKKALLFQIEEVEAPHVHPDLLFAGTPDRVATIGKQLTVIEIKTGPELPWHRLQTSAYALLLFRTRGSRPLRILVRLLVDGTFKVSQHKSLEENQVFQSALVCENWKIKNGYEERKAKWKS